MAYQPMFVANLDELKAELRLAGVPQGEDVERMVARAALAVRTRMFKRLGQTRMAQLLAITPNHDAPSSPDELLASTARVVEVEWTRCLLMDLLPVLFTDSSGGALDAHNEAGLFRKADPDSLTEIRDRCMAMVVEGLEELDMPEEGASGANVATLEPDPCKTPRLGASICHDHHRYRHPECEAVDAHDLDYLFGCC